MSKPSVIRLDSNAKLAQWPDFPESEISSGDRGSRGYLLLDDPALGLKVGIWEAEANLGRWMKWPAHEFMIVLEGEVVMVEEDRETVVGTGESFFIPKGRRCIWNQAGYFKKIMVLFDDLSGDSGSVPIVKIDPDVKLKSSAPPPQDVLLSRAPTQNAYVYFENPAGTLSLGVWDSTGYRRKAVSSPRHELMYLLEGSVTIADGNGTSQTFTKCDTLFVPLGAPNSWESEGYLRKIFCIVGPR